MADFLLSVGVDVGLSYDEMYKGIEKVVEKLNNNPPKIKVGLDIDNASVEKFRTQITQITSQLANLGGNVAVGAGGMSSGAIEATVNQSKVAFQDAKRAVTDYYTALKELARTPNDITLTSDGWASASGAFDNLADRLNRTKTAFDMFTDASQRSKFSEEEQVQLLRLMSSEQDKYNAIVERSNYAEAKHRDAESTKEQATAEKELLADINNIVNAENAYQSALNKINAQRERLMSVNGGVDTEAYSNLVNYSARLRELLDNFNKTGDINAFRIGMKELNTEYLRNTSSVNEYIRLTKEQADAEKERISLLREAEILLKKITKAETNYTAAKNGKSSSNYRYIKDEKVALQDLISQYETGKMSAEEFKTKLASLRLEYERNDGAIRSCGEATKSWGDRIGGLAQKFGTWFSITRVIMTSVRVVRQMVSASIELDDAMTQLQIVTRETDSAMESFGDNAAATAKRIGSSITDFVDSATTYARLGYSLEDSSMLAEYTAMLQNVGNIDVGDAQDAITAIIKAYDDIDINNIEQVMDKLVTTGNNFPISVAQIAEGMNNASSTLAAAGNTFEQSVALLTAANTTIQNAAKSSTGLRTITARIRNTKADLDELGEVMTKANYDEIVQQLTHFNVALTDVNGEYRSTYDIMADIAAKWGDMTSMEQAAMATALAGTRQQAVFYSIIQNFQEASGAMDAMANSAGALDKAYSTYMESATAHINQFKAAFQEFSSNLITSGTISFIVDIGTGIVNALNALQKVHLLLPSIVATIAIIKGIGIAKSIAASTAKITTLTAGLVANKGASDALTSSVAQLTLQEKQRLAVNIQNAVASRQLTVQEGEQILKTLGLATAEGGLIVANKGLAASFKSLMASIPVWGWITLGISLVLEAVNLLTSSIGGSTDKIKELEDEFEQIRNTVTTAANDFRDLKQSSEEVIPRFVELASGVNEFGENVSLTDEEYAEFIKLNNRIAEMFPELDMGLDSNGNHILALSYSVDTLTESINNLIEAEREAANEKIAGNMRDTLENIKSADEKYNNEKDPLQFRLDTYRSAVQQIQDIHDNIDFYKSFGGNWEASYQSALETNLDEMEFAFSDGTDRGVQLWRDMIAKYSDATENGFRTDWYKVINSDEFKNQMSVVEKQIDDIDKKQSARWKKLTPIVGAWLQTTDAYNAAEDSVQSLLTQVIGNIDYSKIKITDEQKFKEYIQKNFIDPITNAEPAVQNAMVGLFDIKSAFDSGALTVGEYGIVDYILGDLKEAGISDEILLNIKAQLNTDEFEANVEFVKNNLKSVSDEYGKTISKIKELGEEYNNLVNGNVDYNKRPYISMDKYVSAGWERLDDDVVTTADVIKGIGYGEYNYTLLVTPVLENGDVLSDEALTNYVNNLVVDGGVDELLESDTLSLVIDVKEGEYDEKYYTELQERIGNIKNEHYELVDSIGLASENFGDEFDEIASKYESVEDYVNSLSGTELKLAYEILQENGSMSIEELQAKMKQIRYESVNMVEPLSLDGFIDDLDKAANGIDKVVSAMEKLANGTELTKKELLELIKQYPELIQQADLFAEGSVEAQKSALNAILDMKEQEYDAQIDAKIAELEATQQVLEDQLALEEQKSILINDIKNMEVNGKVTQEEEFIEKLNELNDLQGTNYVSLKDGELQVNEEALNDQLEQGNDFGGKAAENIWEPYGKTIVSAHEQGYTGALTATNSYTSSLWTRISSYFSRIGSAIATAWKDMWSGNWKGIGAYFSNSGGTGEGDISGGPVVVNFGGVKTTIDGQDIDDWISEQDKASKKRVSQIKDIQAKTLNAINNLEKLKGLSLKDVYASASSDSSKSGSGSSKSSDSESGSSKSSDSKDEENIFKALYNYHKHLIEMEQETTAEFLKWLNDAYKEAYKNGEITLDEYYKYEEEVFKGLRTLEKNAKSAIDSLVDYRIKMLKQDLSNEKDNLKKRLDALKDFYDKQKEMLQDAYDEEKYLENQSEKRKSVSDIQAELAQLEYDNSAWAQKRKLELQQDLADAQKELDEFESEHALDLALDAIDNAYNEQEARIQAEMDALEEKLNDPNALYNQALSDIKNNTLNTYNEMLKFNKEYGDGKDETVKDMWEDAYKANEEYKTANGSGYNGINIGNYTGYTSNQTNKTTSSGSSGSGTTEQKSTNTSSSNSTTTSSDTKLDDATKRKVAAAIWNGGYGWGNNPDRAKRLTEVFGANNGIQDLVNKGVGMNDAAPSKDYTYLNMRKKFKGYASGTRKAVAGIHAIDELGTETIFQSADGTKYKMFTGGEKVLNAKASNFLYDFANNGSEILDKIIRSFFGGGIGGITPPMTNNEIKMGDIYIQGNASSQTVSEIRRAQRQSLETMLKELNKLNR